MQIYLYIIYTCVKMHVIAYTVKFCKQVISDVLRLLNL